MLTEAISKPKCHDYQSRRNQQSYNPQHVLLRHLQSLQDFEHLPVLDPKLGKVLECVVAVCGVYPDLKLLWRMRMVRVAEADMAS